MTEVWPLRFRALSDGELIFADETGRWFRSTEGFLERYVHARLTASDEEHLIRNGHAFEHEGDLQHTAFLHRWFHRHLPPESSLRYLILVPTLRCNLSCDYCQVSRAAEGAKGFDWTDERRSQVLAFIDRLETETIQIEFQGGEPTLRLDHLNAVRDFCRKRFTRSEFIVCSNLQRVDSEVWAFLADEDTRLSTSIDGPLEIQAKRRTHSIEEAKRFFANLGEYVARFGSARLAALPTIDVRDPPDLSQLVDTYLAFGLTSIYLRPINRQGFARRAPIHGDETRRWAALHAAFIDYLVQRNSGGGPLVEEYYFSHALRRVLRPGENGHVDLRNPNPAGWDYIIIDQNGVLFPSDEARMMARVGQIDLSIGHIASGLDRERLDQLNHSSFNDFDPDCRHCVYQPFCGVDHVDDISRHGHFDLPRHETWFCQRHFALFDKLFEMMTSSDSAVRYSMAKWAGLETWPEHFSERYA